MQVKNVLLTEVCQWKSNYSERLEKLLLYTKAAVRVRLILLQASSWRKLTGLNIVLFLIFCNKCYFSN